MAAAAPRAQAQDSIGGNVLATSREGVKQYPAHKMFVEKFVRAFEANQDLGGRFGRRKYKSLLQKAANRWTETVQIDLDDIEKFVEKEFPTPDADIQAALGKDGALLQDSLR